MRFFRSNRRKKTAHAELLPGREERKHRSGRLVLCLGLAALGLVGAAIYGCVCGYDALRDVYCEQCRVEDPDVDVVVTSGKMVQRDIITMRFGLTNGVNLADIPFESLRDEVLERVPNIRSMTITRRMPNRVTIDVVEREPVARLAAGARGGPSGRVADEDGVVFEFSRNVGMLPIIRDRSEAPGTPPVPPGKRMCGRAAAALRLVAAATAREFADLRLLEVDIAKRDFLVMTLGDYSQVKIAWEKMDEDSNTARKSLRNQLDLLAKSIACRVGEGSVLWNATDFGSGRIYAENPANADR